MPRNARVGGAYVTFSARNEQFINATKQNVTQIQRQRRAQSQLRNSARQLRQTFRGLASSLVAFAGVAGIGAATASMTRFVKQATTGII